MRVHRGGQIRKGEGMRSIPSQSVRIVCLISLLLWPEVLLAHGVVGKRLFVEPIATEDANVFSEYDLVVPSYIKGDFVVTILSYLRK